MARQYRITGPTYHVYLLVGDDPELGALLTAPDGRDTVVPTSLATLLLEVARSRDYGVEILLDTTLPETSEEM